MQKDQTPLTGGIRDQLEVAILTIEGIPRDEFIEALSFRSTIQIVDRAPEGRGHVFVGVRPIPESFGMFSIELIVSDGRAYDRHVQATGEQAARIVASTVAQLLAAVHDGAIRPDRSDVSIPAAEPKPPNEVPQREPVRSVRPGAIQEPSSPEGSPRSGVDLGLTVGFGVALGLTALDDIGPFAGAGGLLDLDLRLPRGALLSAGIRWVGARDEDLGFLRTRFALGGGYAFRVRRFELPIVATVMVEPWWVLEGGKVIAVSEGPSGPPLLVGGGLRIAPRFRIPLRKGPVSGAVAVGPRLELDVTTVPNTPLGAARILQVHEVGEEPIFRAGGVEAWVGLDLTVWFELGDLRTRSKDSRLPSVGMDEATL